MGIDEKPKDELEAKREDLLNGFALWIRNEAEDGYLNNWTEFRKDLSEEQQQDYFVKLAGRILHCFSENGVVLKVEGKLPATETLERSIILADYIEKSGFTAVEPLIEE